MNRFQPTAVLALTALAGAAAAQPSPASWHLFSFPSRASDDHFGFRVAAVGDVDGDGHDDALVGAPFTAVGGRGMVGKVYVYSGADGRVLVEASGDPARDTWFGWPPAGAGDVDGDGLPDLMAAARDVLVLLSGRTGAELRRIDAAGIADGLLGALGDVDGDGLGDVVVDRAVGAAVYSGGTGVRLREYAAARTAAPAGDVDGDGITDIALDDGSNVVAIRSGRDDGLLRTIAAPSGISRFGGWLSPAGDADGDGRGDLIVGEVRAPGSVFLFSGRDGSLIRRLAGGSLPTAFEPKGAGDVDGDGHDDISMTLNWGRVVVVSGATGAVIADYRHEPLQVFGSSAAGIGDADGDGFADVLIGDYTGGPHHTGIAHVMSGRAKTMTSDTHAVAAAAGGMQTLRLDLGPARAGDRFLVVGSASGSRPGIGLWGGVHLPLNPDGYLLLTAGQPGLLVAPAIGTLDAAGTATALLAWPAGLGVPAGTVLHHAALILRADSTAITAASDAVPLLLQ